MKQANNILKNISKEIDLQKNSLNRQNILKSSQKNIYLVIYWLFPVLLI